MGEETKERKQKKGGKMEDPASGKGLLCGGVFALVPVLKEWIGRSSQWNVGKNRDWENGQGVRGVGWWNWRR